MGICGKYFSFTSASVVVNDDLISKAEILTGQTNILAKKVTLISSGSLAIDINNLGVDSTLYRDTNGVYKLSLSDEDVIVSSLKIGQSSACSVFLEIVF